MWGKWLSIREVPSVASRRFPPLAAVCRRSGALRFLYWWSVFCCGLSSGDEVEVTLLRVVIGDWGEGVILVHSC